MSKYFAALVCPAISNFHRHVFALYALRNLKSASPKRISSFFPRPFSLQVRLSSFLQDWIFIAKTIIRFSYDFADGNSGVISEKTYTFWMATATTNLQHKRIFQPFHRLFRKLTAIYFFLLRSFVTVMMMKFSRRAFSSLLASLTVIPKLTKDEVVENLGNTF